MPVIWDARRGRNWDAPALAVPCPSCNAEIGKPCGYAARGYERFHDARACMAEALGFVVVADAPLLDAPSAP